MGTKNEERAAYDHIEQALAMVPVKPSQAMISAGWKVGIMGMDRDGPQAIWAAMLAAAPAHPAERHVRCEVQMRRDWIACTERLPADKRDVMVYCADSDEHMVGSSIGGGLFLFATASHGEKVVCRPTHWRYIDESDKPDLAASTGQEVKP